MSRGVRKRVPSNVGQTHESPTGMKIGNHSLRHGVGRLAACDRMSGLGSGPITGGITGGIRRPEWVRTTAKVTRSTGWWRAGEGYGSDTLTVRGTACNESVSTNLRAP